MNTTLSDRELVEGLILNDETIIRDLYRKCIPMFHSISVKVYHRQVEIRALAHELYLYLREDDCRRLRQFDFSTNLMTWLTKVAFRFFQKKKIGLLPTESIEMLSNEPVAESDEERIHQRLEAELQINKIPNKRYREVIRKLDLEDREPNEVADEMGISVENLYNIRHRAHKQLARIVGVEKK